MSPSVTPAPAAAVLFACSGEESEQVQDEHESHESPGSHEGLEGHESEGPLVLNFETGHFHN